MDASIEKRMELDAGTAPDSPLLPHSRPWARPNSAPRRWGRRSAPIERLGNKKLLGAKGIATSSKDATNGAPGLTTRNKKLLGIEASRRRRHRWFPLSSPGHHEVGLDRCTANTSFHRVPVVSQTSSTGKRTSF